MDLGAARETKPQVVHIPWLHIAGETLALMAAMWWLWLVLGAVALAKLGHRVYENRRLVRSGIYDVDLMDGRTFERYLSILFQRLGYKVERTRYRGDYGADLILRRDGKRIVVQAKRWKKSVGVKAVQEAVASKGYYNADAAMVVANQAFTQQARILARANRVELWDRDRLVKETLSHPVGHASPATYSK